MDQKEWLNIITKLYPKLHISKSVEHHSNKSDKKLDKILSWLNKVEKIHNYVSIKGKDSQYDKMYKNMYYDIYVIKKENIPESYYLKQKQLLRERGFGDIELTNKIKEEMADKLILDQKDSLEKWLDYFLYDEEAKSYSFIEMYWVFQGLQKLGAFNKETNTFDKRDNTTIYPFPELEREAIFTTINLMEEYLKDKNNRPKKIENALTSYNFKQLYEYSLKLMLEKNKKNINSNEGIWIKYDQGSDYHILRNSLQGHYTGWYTEAGENFAKTQLKNGDFYVFYTLDKNNEYKVPRIAIRMDGHNRIGEIRGINKDQNLESEMLPILDKKLEEFPDRDKYYKKERDMVLLTKIDKKVEKNIELTLEELKFLYEIDDKILGFGYKKDPRIDEIKNKRNIYKDLAKVFNCKEEEIGIEKNDDDYHDKKYYVGDLYLSGLTNAEGLVLPEKIGGSLDLGGLTSTEGLVLPKEIGVMLDLNGLTNAEGLVLPKEIGGYLDLRGLTPLDGLEIPDNLIDKVVLPITLKKGRKK